MKIDKKTKEDLKLVVKLTTAIAILTVIVQVMVAIILFVG